MIYFYNNFIEFRLISGLHWKDPSTATLAPQFVDPLRNIMQRKLSKLGMLYYYMFVASELDGSS